MPNHDGRKAGIGLAGNSARRLVMNLVMNSNYLTKNLARILLGLSLVIGIVVVSNTAAQAQWGRERRDMYRMAQDRGYEDGLTVGSEDARRGEGYNPERSRFYRDATHGYEPSYAGGGAYRQAYRDAFLRGYEEGYRRNNNRYDRRSRRWFPFFRG
jgi:hypothetical protein